MLSETLLQAAIDAARLAGADYAEARTESSLTERIWVRDASVERVVTDHDAGWGIHVLAGGGWGFASSSSSGGAAPRTVAERAVEIARASGTKRKIALSLPCDR